MYPQGAGTSTMKEEMAILSRKGHIGKVVTEGKRRIAQNIWGNWNGYTSNRKVAFFGTDDEAAKDWVLKRPAPKATFTIKLRKQI